MENSKGPIETKPKDRDGGYPVGTPKRFRRFLEVIPGVVQWLSILAPIVLPLLGLTEVFLLYLSFLVIYWTIKSLKFTYGLIEGARRYRRDINTDWIELIRKDYKGKFEEMGYVFLCPVYSESFEETLDHTFSALSKSDVGSKKIDVVLTIEEGKKDLQIENYKKIKKKYGKKFSSIQYYIHPQNIPGEIKGVKGGNINWGARNFVKKLEEEGKDLSKYLLISCDSDQRVHRKYLSAITYKYLSSEDRDRAFYCTAIHTYNNNIWKVPPLVRSFFMMQQMALMQSWVVDKRYWSPTTQKDFNPRASFSSFVVNLKTLKEISFWDPEIANDDNAFFWNGVVRYKGNFRGEEIYIPTFNDAVENENSFKTHVSFYKQQYRWGWGIINFPITLASILRDPEFPNAYKFLAIRTFFEDQIWYITIVYVLTLGLRFIPLFNPSYAYSAASVNIDKLFGVLFTVLALSNIPLIITRRKLTPTPKEWGILRHIQDIAETLLVTVNMLTFTFIPQIQAPTEMMLGLTEKKRNFYITEKVNIEKD